MLKLMDEIKNDVAVTEPTPAGEGGGNLPETPIESENKPE